MSAALRYMDEVQQRAGTVTAIVARGARPASAVPVPPPLPRVFEAAPSRKRPRTMSRAHVLRLVGTEKTDCDNAPLGYQPDAHRLDAEHSVVVVQHMCASGAYSQLLLAFVIDERGRVSRPTLDAYTNTPPDNPNEIVDGGWDEKRRRLTSHSRSRGMGDCGTAKEFAWDGMTFRLVELRQMPECNGALDLLPTWRAKVVPR